PASPDPGYKNGQSCESKNQTQAVGGLSTAGSPAGADFCLLRGHARRSRGGLAGAVGAPLLGTRRGDFEGQRGGPAAGARARATAVRGLGARRAARSGGELAAGKAAGSSDSGPAVVSGPRRSGPGSLDPDRPTCVAGTVSSAGRFGGLEEGPDRPRRSRALASSRARQRSGGVSRQGARVGRRAAPIHPQDIDAGSSVE